MVYHVHMPDIDIDFNSTFDPTDIFRQAIPASMVQRNQLVKHPCGHYLQPIPVDPITGLSAIPYAAAEELGFFKIDFLHLSVLDKFKNKQEVRELLKYDPNWDLMLAESVCSRLFQLGKHHELVFKVKPNSVQDVADCIALIRPGKKYLVGEYIRSDNRSAVRSELYSAPRDSDVAWFKKSHAVAYAKTISLQLHLIEHGLM